MSTQNQDKITSSFDVKPFELAVGAVAAVVAAFASSFLGVAGTVIGAAVASVVTPVSAAVVRQSAQRTNASLARTNQRVRAALGRDDADSGQGALVDPDRPDRPDRKPLWTRRRVTALSAASLVAFAAALVAVTGVESAIGKPLSALLGNNSD